MGKYGLGGHKLGEGGEKNLFSAFRRNCGWTVVAERIFPAIRACIDVVYDCRDD